MNKGWLRELVNSLPSEESLGREPGCEECVCVWVCVCVYVCVGEKGY